MRVNLLKDSSLISPSSNGSVLVTSASDSESDSSSTSECLDGAAGCLPFRLEEDGGGDGESAGGDGAGVFFLDWDGVLNLLDSSKDARFLSSFLKSSWDLLSKWPNKKYLINKQWDI